MFASELYTWFSITTFTPLPLSSFSISLTSINMVFKQLDLLMNYCPLSPTISCLGSCLERIWWKRCFPPRHQKCYRQYLASMQISYQKYPHTGSTCLYFLGLVYLIRLYYRSSYFSSISQGLVVSSPLIILHLSYFLGNKAIQHCEWLWEFMFSGTDKDMCETLIFFLEICNICIV